MTTGAFKIAGGVDLSSSAAPSSRLAKQNSISTLFTSKITKAFLDSLYAFLDGLVHLASDESPPNIVSQALTSDLAEGPTINSSDLLDVRNVVRIKTAGSLVNSWITTMQDTRLLLVISNFGHLSRTVIPSMLNELESAFGT
jgi:exocyst complex component 2